MGFKELLCLDKGELAAWLSSVFFLGWRVSSWRLREMSSRSIWEFARSQCHSERRMRIFDMMTKKVIEGGSRSNNDGLVNVVVSSAAGEEAQGREFKGFKVGVDPVMWDSNSRSHHGTSNHRLLCQLNGSLDGPSSVTTLRECTSHEGSAHSSNGTTLPHKAKANGTVIHNNNNNNHGCCSPKVLKVSSYPQQLRQREETASSL